MHINELCTAAVAGDINCFRAFHPIQMKFMDCTQVLYENINVSVLTRVLAPNIRQKILSFFHLVK